MEPALVQALAAEIGTAVEWGIYAAIIAGALTSGIIGLLREVYRDFHAMRRWRRIRRMRLAREVRV